MVTVYERKQANGTSSIIHVCERTQMYLYAIDLHLVHLCTVPGIEVNSFRVRMAVIGLKTSTQNHRVVKSIIFSYSFIYEIWLNWSS